MHQEVQREKDVSLLSLSDIKGRVHRYLGLGEKAQMRKLTVLLALLITTVTVTPSLAYYHHHRHTWGGGSRCRSLLGMGATPWLRRLGSVERRRIHPAC